MIEKEYLANRVANANDAQLVALVYEGLIDTLQSGIEYIECESKEKLNSSINKVREILAELLATLQGDSEISSNLRSIYVYVNKIVTQAELKEDKEKLEEAIKGIGPIEMGNIISTSNKKSEVQNKQFVEKFQNIKSEQVREHLEKLFTQITTQSEKINEKLHISEVIRYKSLVKEFLDVAVKSSHQFSKQNFLDRRGRHRVYSIVKNVDRELEAITKEFLNKEVDRLAIVNRLDDIRGMLLDILM